jgi:hypothetical protein
MFSAVKLIAKLRMAPTAMRKMLTPMPMSRAVPAE